jgi:general L-amino acid transport system ATP-binding protein
MSNTLIQTAQQTHPDIPAVLMQGVQKWYDSFQVLTDIELAVKPGERVVLCGPSGSGKSTLLRCINGLEHHQQGRIAVYGDEVNETAKSLNLIRRKIGICFQQFNLFPHLTILDNCTLALIWLQKQSKAQAEEVAMHYLTKLAVADQANKFPGQLSGGQQQRVAIARALCLKPTIMLFDEPTSALDPEMIWEVLDAMTNLAKEGMTMLCATHEMRFAREVADRVIFMDKGQIIEQADPETFFTNPVNARTRAFLEKVIH